MNEPTNEARAERAHRAMDTYCWALEGRDFRYDEDDIRDLLADLMHLCDLQTGIDFEANLRIARDNFEAERSEV